MVTTAFVKLWGERIGAVAWDDTQGLGVFEYDKSFIAKKMDISPLKMPLYPRIYSFPELRNTPTFKGIS